MNLTKFISRIDLSESRVDKEHHIIKDVSLVSLGEARGHSKIADTRTLEQVCECARQYKSGLRVRFNVNTFNHGDAALAGYIARDSIKVNDAKDKVVGDLHVYASYPHKDYLYEIAERAPDNFGLSIEFSGLPESIGGIDFARCDEIFAATIVDLPAANPTGLFAADLTNDNKDSKSSVTKHKTKGDDMSMTDEQVTKLGEQVTAGLTKGLAPVFEKFRMKQETPATGDPTAEELEAAGCTDEDTPEQKTEKINAYRANLNKPITQASLRKELMEVFRFTGGKAAKSSGAVTDEEKKKAAGDSTFESLVTEFRQKNPDVSESTAILEVRKKNGKAYNEYCTRGRPAIIKQEASK